MDFTDREIESGLRQLKNIRPEGSWVVFGKEKLFATQPAKRSFGAVFSRPLAYSLAALAVALLGVAGYAGYGMMSRMGGNDAPQNSLNELASVQDSVAAFTQSSQQYAKAVKEDPQQAQAIAQQVQDAAKNLASAIQQDPQAAKQVALQVNNNRSYLDVSSGDSLSKAPSLVELYQATARQLLDDAKKETLTSDQQRTVAMAEEYYKQGKYDLVVEDMLLLGQ